jgi:hypothetical protein
MKKTSQANNHPGSINRNVSLNINEPDTGHFLQIKNSLEKVADLGVLNPIWSFILRKYSTINLFFPLVIPQRQTNQQTNGP